MRLTRRTLEVPKQIHAPASEDWPTIKAGDIYQVYFHGPAYQVLEKVQLSDDRAVGWMAESLPPNTQPAEAADLISPRLIELCLQTAGVWEMKTKGVLALPTAIGKVTSYRTMDGIEGNGTNRLRALVQSLEGGDRFDAQVVDGSGNVYLALTGYRTVQLPNSIQVQ